MKRLALLCALTISLVAACGGASAAAQPPIHVDLAEMTIGPDRLVVAVGRPVTFVVRNVGVVEREFFIGPEAAQLEHEQEMVSGAMPHGHGNAVTVAAGATGELTMIFAKAGATIAGCHLPGHYAAGMKATIEVRGS
jgi:uncharacterized cupredoxin-like copper-binding protein